MPISSGDISLIIEALVALLRILDDPLSQLPDFAVPAIWYPFAPEAWLPKEPVAQNWVRSRWWQKYCESVSDRNRLDQPPLDPDAPPPLSWLTLGVSEVLLARLMPSEVGIAQIKNGSESSATDDILDSQLDNAQKLALIEVRNYLVAYRLFRETRDSDGARLEQREALLGFCLALGKAIDSFGSNIVNPAEALAGLYLSRQKAYAQYRNALKQNPEFGNDPTDVSVYEWVKEHLDSDDVRLPTFKTWCRYLREARAALGLQKHTPRRSRQAGKSVIRKEQI